MDHAPGELSLGGLKNPLPVHHNLVTSCFIVVQDQVPTIKPLSNHMKSIGLLGQDWDYPTIGISVKKQIDKILREVRPDIVHANNIFAAKIDLGIQSTFRLRCT